jgi:hypothetical protein
MGVITTADEHRNNARDHINKAIRELMVVVDEGTWGHGDYNTEYMVGLEVTLAELMKLKRNL